jgi:hypothetical protein
VTNVQPFHLGVIEMQDIRSQESLLLETQDVDENSVQSPSSQALLDILSTDPPRSINIIEMIAKSGGHICSSIQGPSPEMINRVVDLSDI